MQILAKGETFLAITCPGCKAYLAAYPEDLCVSANPEDVKAGKICQCPVCSKIIDVPKWDIPKKWLEKLGE